MDQQLRMTKTIRGAPDGMRDYLYLEGVEYPTAAVPMSEELAAVFLREEWAVLVAAGPPVSSKPDGPTDSGAMCAVKLRSGELCGRRRPCVYHERTVRR